MQGYRQPSPWKYRRNTKHYRCTSRLFHCQTGSNDHRACSPDRGERHVRIRGGPRPCRRDRGVDGAGATQWVSSGAPMPGVPERCAAGEVNAMLACGGSYAQIVRALGEDNALLDKRDQVTVDSVRTHTTKHFPVQQTAHATYREILERRARENQIDFVDGVAIALTPIAFYEVVMAKAFRATSLTTGGLRSASRGGRLAL